MYSSATEGSLESEWIGFLIRIREKMEISFCDQSLLLHEMVVYITKLIIATNLSCEQQLRISLINRTRFPMAFLARKIRTLHQDHLVSAFFWCRSVLKK